MRDWQEETRIKVSTHNKVASDTDLAGYLANNSGMSGYLISVQIYEIHYETRK